MNPSTWTEEEVKILGAQVHLVLGTPKVEAVVLWNFSLGVLALVSAGNAFGSNTASASYFLLDVGRGFWLNTGKA